MKTYSLKTSQDSPVSNQDKGKFLAIQGNSLWFQDSLNGWAAFTSRDQLLSYQKTYGGEILEFEKK